MKKINHLNLRKIGIGPMFLKSEYEILLETTKKYNKCIDKII